MANWADFFYGVCAGSALTILGMTATTYAVWHALLSSIVGHARKPERGEGPWDG